MLQLVPRSLLLLCALCAGCAPRFDDVSDRLQADVQKKIDAGLVRLEIDRQVLDMIAAGQADATERGAIAKDAGYAGNVGFYADVQSDLDVLQGRLRAQGDKSAPLITASLGQVRANVLLLRTLHAKEGVPSAAFLEGLRATIDQQFQPLTLYQIQLRGG